MLSISSKHVSSHLKHTGSREAIHALLYGAGVAALRMPRLHTMTLWNGRKENACAFIYQTENGCSSITWRGTWDLELEPHVVEVWQEVASKFHSTHLRVNQQQMQDYIGCHGDAIQSLELPYRVVDPISLWQIRSEQ
jgi:hypothetical protein